MNNSNKLIRNLQIHFVKPFAYRIENITHYYSRLYSTTVPVKEIKIPVQWGHIAAKVWGDADRRRPILALHGWQDNAGTWDTLAPMICNKIPILAIDFPGHGLSSCFAPGIQYYSWEFARLLLTIKNHFHWDKVTVLGHSMGSIAAMRYACIFPDDLDYFIALDSLFPEERDIKEFIKNYPKIINKIQLLQDNLEPPLYTKKEIMHKWHTGTNKSISIESVKYMAERGIKQSANDGEKYYFSRDSRMSYAYYDLEDTLFLETLTRRLKCPNIYLKAINSPFSTSKTFAKLHKALEESNPNFESHLIPGTHHVHLNNPDVVIPYINTFLQKYKLI